MVKHFLSLMYRLAMRNRLFTAINVGGLAIGLACCLMIFLYVKDELSFDAFHSKADRIYRINEILEAEGGGERSASLPFPMGPTLVLDHPHLVEAAVRFFNFQAPTLTLEYRDHQRIFNERRLYFADPDVFKVFDFRLRAGDPTTALAQPDAIVLTSTMAQKYFGAEDPMGRTLRFQGNRDLTVTGVLEEVPQNSHITFDFLVSFATVPSFYPKDAAGLSFIDFWYWNPCWTYVLLKPGTGAEEFTNAMPNFVQKYFPQVIKNDVEIRLQSLKDIHLTSRLDYELQPNGSMENVYILSVVGLFVLLIACINFTNLATARAVQRAREVGLRKTLGSARSRLIAQFMSESIAYASVAILVAVILVELMLPTFNAISGKAIGHGFWREPAFLLSLVLLAGLTGLIAGIYPAFVLSSFSPSRVLRSGTIRYEGFDFRRVLVVAQFAVSCVLIVSTLVGFRQLEHLQTSDLGFQKEHIVMLPVLRSSMADQYEAFKTEVLKSNGVRSMTALEEILGAKYQTAHYQFEGMNREELFSHLNVRHDFAKTFSIPVVAGRDYDIAVEADAATALVVNESLVRSLGWASPEAAIGKTVDGGRRIIGVVRDFNFASRHLPITPLVLTLNPQRSAFNLFIKYAAIQVDPRNAKETLTFIEQTWRRFVPDKAFEYFYLDQDLQHLYDAEERLAKVATVFAVLAILVACLGLFGHATHMVECRTKEIGIRKTLGASVANVVGLLSRDSLMLLVPAVLIAIPVSWFVMNRWLASFAYRVEIEWWVFAVAAGSVVSIACVTILGQTVRAALDNPVIALKHE